MVEVQTETDRYAVFLLHADGDESWVEEHLAARLEDEANLRPHFLKWHRIAGISTQENMQNGFDKSECCAVCLGKGGLGGLQHMMQEAATKRKSKVPGYRLIPVMLPGYDLEAMPDLLDGLTCVDLREEKDFDEQFHLLVCGIKGVPPGRPRPKIKAEGPPADGPSKEEVLDEKRLARYMRLLDVAEKNGLPKEEAMALRRAAIERHLDDINRSFSIDEVTVRGNRGEGT